MPKLFQGWTTARMIVRLGKDDQVTHVLHDLHWLPIIKLRVHFKVLLYTYKGLNDHAPSCICDMIEIYKPAKPLRSGRQRMLVVPKTKTKGYGV